MNKTCSPAIRLVGSTEISARNDELVVLGMLVVCIDPTVQMYYAGKISLALWIGEMRRTGRPEILVTFFEEKVEIGCNQTCDAGGRCRKVKKDAVCS